MSMTDTPPSNNQVTSRPNRPRPDAAPAGSEPNEKAVLAGCLVSSQFCVEACESLSAQDFSAPGWAACFDAVKHLWQSTQLVDVGSVIEHMRTAGTLQVVGGEQAVLGLLPYADSVASVRAPIRIILDYAARRQIRAFATTLGSMAADPAHPVGDLIAFMGQQSKEVELPTHGGEAITVQSLVDQPDAPYDWVIPGLLERQDRTIVVAPEGYGKALAVDTPIHTVTGLRTMAGLQAGDQVLGSDGQPTTVIAATEITDGRPCYRLEFSDGSEITADAEHQWAVQKLADGPATNLLRVLDTRALATLLALSQAGPGGLAVPACVPLRLPGRRIMSVQPVPPVPVRCIQVANPDGIYLAGLGRVPTHNSTLLRQVAVMGAAGLHPFTPSRPIPPVRTLIVDAENRERTIRRAMGRLVDQAVYQSGDTAWAALRCHLWSTPSGLDLHNRADQARLVSTVRQVQPDLVTIGPLYKLMSGDPSDEEVAKELSEILDHVAVRYNCALLIEAHAPHGQGGRDRQMRPFGASLWQRWPEFGLGMYPADGGAWDVRHWRGQREEREWPTKLVRGDYWPWVEVRDGQQADEVF